MAKKKVAKPRGRTVTLTAADVRQLEKALAIIRRVKAQRPPRRSR